MGIKAAGERLIVKNYSGEMDCAELIYTILRLFLEDRYSGSYGMEGDNIVKWSR